jgi:cell division protease FtsH
MPSARRANRWRASTQLTDVTIQGNNISGHFTDSRAFTTCVPNNPDVVNRLTAEGVRITAAPAESLSGVLISWSPVVLLIGVWIIFFMFLDWRRRG